MKTSMPDLPIRSHLYLPDPEAVEWDGRLRCMCGLPKPSRVHRDPPADDTNRIIGEGTKP